MIRHIRQLRTSLKKKRRSEVRKINKDIIEKYNFFPLAPVENYLNYPFVKWGNPENQINDLDKLEALSGVTGAALLTGKPSGIMVVDLDNHVEGISGPDNFSEIWTDEELNTLMVNTPNNGIHLYFKYREGLKSDANLWPGVDIKTDGGLIMLPGSQRKKQDGSVGRYEVMIDAEIQEMPDTLFQKFINKQRKENPGKKKTRSGNDGLKSGVYPQGKRNDSLFKDGMKLFSKSSYKDYTTIQEVLKALNLSKCDPPLEETEIEAISKSVFSSLNPDYCNEGGHVILYSLMEHLLREQPIFCRGNLTFQYSEVEGCYKQMDANKLSKYYFDHCQLDTDKVPVRAKNFTELLFMVASDPENTFLEKDLINCENGVIKWKTGDLIPHDPQHKLISQIRAKYRVVEKEEFENSHFKRFLDSTLDKESQLTLQEATGLAISPHSKEVQKCFVLLGEGSNGKSLFMNILRSLFNTENVASIGFSDFSKDFDLAQGEGALVNIKMDDDMTGLSEKVGQLWKSFTCADEVRVNKKFRDIRTMTFNVTSFYGLNKLPSVVEKVHGFYRRVCILDFKKKFGTEEEISSGIADALKDPFLEAYIIENELDIVLHWAVEGLRRLSNSKWNLTEGAATKEAMEEYKLDSDSAYAYFVDCIREQPDNHLLFSAVYENYTWWCNENGIKPVNGSNFGKRLKALGVKSGRLGGGIRGLYGIKFGSLDFTK